MERLAVQSCGSDGLSDNSPCSRFQILAAQKIVRLARAAPNRHIVLAGTKIAGK